jgi:acyl-CoA thioester hydrolase
MKVPPDAVSVELEVPFHDVDALQIVWHGNYFKYMGVASTALFRAHGLDPAGMDRSPFRLLVVDAHCRHAFPLRYCDRFRVSAWFHDLDLRVSVAYEIVNLTHGRRSAKGRTVMVSLDLEGNLLYSTPPALAELLRAAPSAVR